MSKHKIVEVEWLDAQTHSSHIQEIGELEDWKPFITKSAGYLLYEDKEKIILGFMLFEDERDINKVKHLQMIPRGMIKKIKVVKGREKSK